MSKERFCLAALVCAGLMLCNASAQAWDRGDVDTFAVLPAGSPMIEGLTIDARDGKVYTPTFDPTGASGPAKLFTFSEDGNLIRTVTIQGASSATLGLAFHPMTHALLVIDFGAGKVLNVNPVTGASTVFTTVTGASGLNALTFDRLGNVYISDSFQGIIWKTPPTGAPVATNWVQSPLLTTVGVPGFGANGIEFNKAQSIMFVANTGMDQLIQIPVSPAGTPGTPTVFTNSINGADGIVLDRDDNIWTVANQADEIVVVDPTGKAIAKLGDFNGIGHDGVTRSLLFPASPAFTRDGKSLLVTNLKLDLRVTGAQQSVDSDYTDQVKHHSIARIKARIPQAGDGDGH